MRSMKLNGLGWSRAAGHLGNVGLCQRQLRRPSEETQPRKFTPTPRSGPPIRASRAQNECCLVCQRTVGIPDPSPTPTPNTNVFIVQEYILG